MAKIVRLTISSPNESFTHTTNEGPVRIGRSLRCEFPIPKEELSREHCLFEYVDGIFFITDLGSKNGVSVDKIRIPPNVKTSINEHSNIMLSDLYHLKINDYDLNTKTKFKLEHIEPQLEGEPLQLELRQAPLIRSKRKFVSKPQEKYVNPSPRFENLKMVIGFLIILGFIIYQALGR